MQDLKWLLKYYKYLLTYLQSFSEIEVFIIFFRLMKYVKILQIIMNIK